MTLSLLSVTGDAKKSGWDFSQPDFYFAVLAAGANGLDLLSEGL